MANFLRKFSQKWGRWGLYCALSIQALPASAQLLDTKALFDWAELTFPTLFTSHETTQQTGNYAYRYYAGSGNALGVSDGIVYALGTATGKNLVAVDTLAAFQCLVYPDRCKGSTIEFGSTPLRYGKTAIFTIAGSAVEQTGAKVTVGAQCSNAQLLQTIGKQVRNVSCTLTGTGNFSITVKDANGAELASHSFTIPEPRVQIQTSEGTLVVQLNPTAAPITVANFMQYVNAGFYTNTLFHRVIPGFMAQGGGYISTTSSSSSTTTTTSTTSAVGMSYKTPIATGIKLESTNNSSLSNLRGTIAMARTSVADSATSQFFINLVDNAFLNYASSTSPGYAVFGSVVDGMAVVDKIAAIPTKSVNGTTDIPTTNIVILNATQIQ